MTTNLAVESTIRTTLIPELGWMTALRFVAATALFCPQVSVLGAKRPQHQAWHAIVLSLWLILILPAAEGYFVRRSAALEVHDARGWFLWLLILVGFTNYVATRHWVAAIAYALAQTILLARHLPLLRNPPGEVAIALAFACLLIATLLVTVRRNLRQETGYSRLWNDFRDAYGAVWSLRLMDRLNQTGRLCNWPFEFTWDGVSDAQIDSLDGKQRTALHRAVRTVLRRFVAAEWIEQRIGVAPDGGQHKRTAAASAAKPT